MSAQGGPWNPQPNPQGLGGAPGMLLAPPNYGTQIVVPGASSVVAYQGAGETPLGLPRPATPLYAEVSRILNLPLVTWMDPGQEEELNRRHVLAQPFADGWRLFNPQSNSVAAYERFNGLLGMIGVGWGKTLIGLIIANLAIRKGARLVVIMLPAANVSGLWDRDITWARRYIPLALQFWNLHGKSVTERKSIARQCADRRGCVLFPYSILSKPDAYDLLMLLNADVLVCDEADMLGDPKSARTKRWLSYVSERKPEVCLMSGSFTSKGPNDYAHVARPALRENSPLPLSSHLMNDWQTVLRSSNESEMVPAALTTNIAPVLHWARERFPQYLHRLDMTRAGLRTAYMMRLTTAPGVIATGDDDIGISLLLQNREVAEKEKYPGWEELSKLIKSIEVEWKTPTGDEIEHAIHKYSWMYQLSAGFYYRLYWPTPETICSRRRLDAATAEKVIQAAQDHHAAGQEYAKVLRAWLQDKHRPGLDTPMLVGRDMFHNGAKNVGESVYLPWKTMKSLEFEGMPERDSDAVRVCPYKVWQAVEWARQYTTNGQGGVIWTWHDDLCSWIYEELVKAGATHAIHCPAGTEHGRTIEDTRNSDKLFVATIKGHGRGRNLQYLANQLVVQWPRNAKDAQQLLGRLHRNGQKADALVAHTQNVTEFDNMNFAACLVDAVYIQQTTGMRQKVVHADYDPLPLMYPPEFLRERGFENEIISASALDTLRVRMAS